VVDAQGGMFAARVWWMLRWLGHSAVAVLDGGVPAWAAAGGALQHTAPAVRPAGVFPVRESLVPSIDHAGLRTLLGQPGYRVVDARSADRYRGENETLDPVGGHIPGAVNRCFQDNLTEGRFKAPEQLRQEWQALLSGLAPQDLIHQCGSGVTACHNLLALAYAGLDGGRLYPGSWSEWCVQPDAPMAFG
jgi:thiosulfate/3-mercaptopyruvate sulfurtransferase